MRKQHIFHEVQLSTASGHKKKEFTSKFRSVKYDLALNISGTTVNVARTVLR
jgi:hypothetical protein